MRNMDKKQLIQEIKKGEWNFEFRQRDANPVLSADLWSRAVFYNFSQEANLPIKFNNYIFNDTQCVYAKKKDKKKILKLIKKSISERNYLDFVYKKTLNRLRDWEKFVSHIEKELKGKNNQEKILELWNKYCQEAIKLIPWFYIPWFVTEENMITDKVKKGITKHGEEIDKHTNIKNSLGIATLPFKNTHYQKEQEDYYKLVLIAKNEKSWKKSYRFIKLAQEYLKNYAWMKTFFILPIEPLSFSELCEKVKQSLEDNSLEEYRQRKKSIQKNKKLKNVLLKTLVADKILISDIRWASKFSWLLTFSVEEAFRISARLLPFFKIIAKTAAVPYGDWIHLTVDEINRVLKGEKINKVAIIERRKRGFVFLMKEGTYNIITGKEGHQLALFIDENIRVVKQQSNREIKGQTAMSGKVFGKVLIALRPSDAEKIKEGEVLVCSMTSPDYLSAMKKSAAIITDEGGVLSHAAIVAREMKKPCIIKTKIATQVLKDGDLVEVDANNGIIKVINKLRKKI